MSKEFEDLPPETRAFFDQAGEEIGKLFTNELVKEIREAAAPVAKIFSAIEIIGSFMEAAAKEAETFKTSREEKIKQLMRELDERPYTDIKLDGYHLFEVIEAINKWSQKHRAQKSRNRNADARAEFTEHFRRVSQEKCRSATFSEVIKSLIAVAREGKSEVFSKLSTVGAEYAGEAHLLDEEQKPIKYTVMKRWLTPLRKEFNADIQKKSH
ncbi:TPA: hypothetical protein N2Z50_003252 [Escherichia coli]|nr:hypothetical protein [Escherichia coli]